MTDDSDYKVKARRANKMANKNLSLDTKFVPEVKILVIAHEGVGLQHN